jgi:hypothetical protein
MSSLRDFLEVGIYSINNGPNQDFQDEKMYRISWCSSIPIFLKSKIPKG